MAEEKLALLQEAVTEGTNGAAHFNIGELVEFALVDGRVVEFGVEG